MNFLRSLAPFAAGILLAGCSAMVYEKDGGLFGDGGRYGESYAEDSPGAVGGGEGGSGNGNTQAGIVTAGEWRDLDHWQFWSGLMTGEEYSGKSAYWGFYTNNLVAVHVKTPGDTPVLGAKVVLYRNDHPVWTTITDNLGYAWCYVSPFQELKELSAEELTVQVDGTMMTGHPLLSTWQSQSEVKMNEYELYTPTWKPSQTVTDIAFIVDATGSMGDEISFLKDDLVDILDKAVKQVEGSVIRTASVFYRDEGDTYVTRHSDFNTNVKVTTDFIKQQEADGGGDYPEAVHTALETGLQKLSWGEDSRMRVAFLLLDAPAHHRDAVIASLQKSIETYAKLGIRIVPIAASGADKDTEFMLRFFDILTGGTYTFLTNDSGVGGDHIKPTVGEYTVEQLNDLIVRLIAAYLS